jgi:hypothetical protein
MLGGLSWPGTVKGLSFVGGWRRLSTGDKERIEADGLSSKARDAPHGSRSSPVR